MSNDQDSSSNKIYLAIVGALLFFFIAGALVWVSQVIPQQMRTAAVQATSVAEASLEKSAEAEGSSAQTGGETEETSATDVPVALTG